MTLTCGKNLKSQILKQGKISEKSARYEIYHIVELWRWFWLQSGVYAISTRLHFGNFHSCPYGRTVTLTFSNFHMCGRDPWCVEGIPLLNANSQKSVLWWLHIIDQNFHSVKGLSDPSLNENSQKSVLWWLYMIHFVASWSLRFSCSVEGMCGFVGSTCRVAGIWGHDVWGAQYFETQPGCRRGVCVYLKHFCICISVVLYIYMYL